MMHIYPTGNITDGAVMFCGIRDSTACAELRDPRKVIEFLNRLFSEHAVCVGRAGGFINKYPGGAFMVVFGTHFSNEDYRFAALSAALGW